MPTRLGIIGAGLMGGAIALDAARHGLAVDIYDERPDAVRRLLNRAATVYERWIKGNRLQPAEAEAALARIRPASSLAELGQSDVIIEAVYESLDVKRDVLSALAGHLADNSIVATNTSALKVSDIAEGFALADRFLGLHYFAPAEVCPLVEVIRSDRCSETTLARALSFLAETRRTALLCTDTPGFAINRFFCPYYNEATRIVEDGIATVADVDRVARERLGIPAGPFAVMNLIGPAVAAQAMGHLALLGPFYKPSKMLLDQAARGVNWPAEVLTRADPADLECVEQRLLGALALSAKELMSEGVADMIDVDRGAVLALKFTEGPFALMRRSPTAVEAAVRKLCRRHGHPLPRLAVV